MQLLCKTATWLLPLMAVLFCCVKVGSVPAGRHSQGRALAFATTLGVFVATSGTCAIGMGLHPWPWVLTGALPAAAALSVHAATLVLRHFRRTNKLTAGLCLMASPLLLTCAAATAVLPSVAQAWHMPLSTTLLHLALPTAVVIKSTTDDVRHITELSEQRAPMRRSLEWIAAASLLWPVVLAQILFNLEVIILRVGAPLLEFLVFV